MIKTHKERERERERVREREKEREKERWAAYRQFEIVEFNE